MHYLFLVVIPIIYFSISWYFPWEKLQFNSTVSVSYIFDIVFTAMILAYYKQKNFWGKLQLNGLLVRGSTVLVCAFLCVWLSKILGLKAPFKYLEQPFLQLLILAPIIEELVFRGGFYKIGEKVRHPHFNHSYNAVLFSISHLPAIWFLPQEFRSYIIYQLIYTLVLGWLCSKARERSAGVLEPVILHFIFNLVFYIAIKTQTI